MNFVVIVLLPGGNWRPEEFGRFQYLADAQRRIDGWAADLPSCATAIVPLHPAVADQILWRGRGWLPLDIRARIEAAAAKLRKGQTL